ncbi:hypothetical protein FACS1894170_03260 [Planctomycetales bacterium]|nr:hypothetical protein FACS1894170_03260 [Planctomycetales bacterium]
MIDKLHLDWICKTLYFFSAWCLFVLPIGHAADFSDCLWGGYNEQTNYTATYLSGQGGTALAQQPPPAINLGTPQPAIPVPPTQNTQNIYVPQANIPTVTIPTGAVGSVGQPATSITTAVQAQPAVAAAEIVYVLPSSSQPESICYDGQKAIPASEVKIVPAGTPGAVPVALKTVMVRRPKVERRLSYSPVVTKTNTLVQVVDPRTGRVVKTYCRDDEAATRLPWLHIKEETTYETVSAKVGVPVSVAPTVSTSANTAVFLTSP